MPDRKLVVLATDQQARVSVVIPTIGRPQLLLGTLRSLAACVPAPAEILIVDQSPDCVSAQALEQVELPQARIVACAGRGRGLAVNVGLRAATNPVAAVVDDDCLVVPDWIGVVEHELGADPTAIICGQVLPVGDPNRTPSLLTLGEPRDYTGQARGDVLFAGNMACPREHVLAHGGFDERIVPAAEDCDFCYRWLRAGHRLRHVPQLIVWHCDWREPSELERHYVGYHRGRGMFYGKHLAAGDLGVLRFILRDIRGAVRATAAAWLRGTPRFRDERRGLLRGLPHGIWEGLRLRPG